MPKMTLQELIELCIRHNWDVYNPCEVFFGKLDFPEGDCDGNCAKCLLKATGLDSI